MKAKNLTTAFLVILSAGLLLRLYGQDKPLSGHVEYATIHWAGKENTHIIRAGGEVEVIGSQLRLLRRPEKADERAFYMNAALNGIVKEGFELAAFTPDEIVVKRVVH